MRKRGNQSDMRAQVLELLQGGKPVLQSAGRRGIVAAKSPLEASLQETSKLQQQAAKLRSKMEKPLARAASDRGTARAIHELRAITDKLAKRKPALPVLPLQIPGMRWGSYSLLVTPPYFRSQDVTSIVNGNPDLAPNTDAQTGEISCHAVTDYNAPSGGEADSYMALYFRPLFGPATLSIHANMDIDFAWWVNSLGPTAISRAQGLMRVYIDDTFQVAARAAFLGWSINKAGVVDFDFGSMPGPAWSLSLPVSSNHYYLLVFSVQCFASAAGWPGSLAGAQVNLRIPSVSFDVEGTPVLEA